MKRDWKNYILKSIFRSYIVAASSTAWVTEQGIIPWKKPWSEGGAPQNLFTRRPYRGINIMLLASSGYTENFFVTPKQLKEVGASAKPDEKPHIVVYWNWNNEKESGEEKAEAEAKKKTPILRYYRVFNIAQCNDIPESQIPSVTREAYPIPACEKVVNEMQNKPKILHKENRAFYNPLLDFVNMPTKKNFDSDESYYATLFHELIHSTGHLSRLNRRGLIEMEEFGHDRYSFEELVAEIGACYMESLTGIAPKQFEQNVAYINGWLQRLKNDKKFIIQASAFAQKATDYILNIKQDEVDNEITAPV